ncbi:MAG: hypothetical protein J5636_02985 [Clostridiales bacterium]|nr:hypothetical protein [Clostridiales bacterium]
MEYLKKNKENIFSILASALLAFIFSTESPIHPWVNGVILTDSSVFKTVALMMDHGYMPYKDSFDHKGPFLYIVNWLGNRISEYRGVWVIEFLVLTLSFFMLYKTARLACGILASIMTSLTAASLMFPYFEGGNFTEEYAIPMIAIGLYIFIDYILNDRVSKKRFTLSGICCGIVLMLRPNMISVWIVYCVLIAALLISKKEFKKLAGFTLWFSAGIGIVIIPIAVWLILNNDLTSCIQDYILINMRYSSAEGGRAKFSAQWNSFFVFFNSTVYLIAFFSAVFHVKSKDKLLNISYVVYLVLTITLMVMSGMSYGHYGMILVPAVVYPLSLVFADIEAIKEPGTSKTIMLLISLYLLTVVISPGWIKVFSGLPEKYENKDELVVDDVTKNITDYIQDHTDETERISVYGNWGAIYVLSHRMHATRYSYVFPIGTVMPEIMEEYMESLQKELPVIIVVQAGRYDDNIQTFLNENNYQLEYSSNPDKSYYSNMLFVREQG